MSEENRADQTRKQQSDRKGGVEKNRKYSIQRRIQTNIDDILKNVTEKATCKFETR